MVSGLRGSRFPPVLVVSVLPPAGGGTLSCVVPYHGGGRGSGGPAPPLTLAHLPSGPSPAPPLVCCPLGGVAPHTTPVRAHPASLGTICAASPCAGVGPLVLRGPHVSRRLGRGGGSHSGSPLGRGGPSPLPRGVGAGAPAAGGLVGGRGGGCRAAAALLPFWAAASLPARACGRGRSAAPGWGG